MNNYSQKTENIPDIEKEIFKKFRRARGDDVEAPFYSKIDSMIYMLLSNSPPIDFNTEEISYLIHHKSADLITYYPVDKTNLLGTFLRIQPGEKINIKESDYDYLIDNSKMSSPFQPWLGSYVPERQHILVQLALARPWQELGLNEGHIYKIINKSNFNILDEIEFNRDYKDSLLLSIMVAAAQAKHDPFTPEQYKRMFELSDLLDLDTFMKKINFQNQNPAGYSFFITKKNMIEALGEKKLINKILKIKTETKQNKI